MLWRMKDRQRRGLPQAASTSSASWAGQGGDEGDMADPQRAGYLYRRCGRGGRGRLRADLDMRHVFARCFNLFCNRRLEARWSPEKKWYVIHTYSG